MRRLVNDEARPVRVRKALESKSPEDVFSGKELALLQYAGKLTLTPSKMQLSDMDVLRNAGTDDGEILEVNQVTSYFCYANRTVLGLGVNTEGDIIGLSPNENENPDNWNHA